MKKFLSKYARSIIAVLTTIALIITIGFLTVVPKSTIIEINVYAKQISFDLDSESDDEEIQLLGSSIWTDSISITEFKPFELIVDSVYDMNRTFQLHNPLMITPLYKDSKIIFFTRSANVSLQNLNTSGSGSITFSQDDQNLSIDINNSFDPPFQTISLPEEVNISLHECRITDREGSDFTALFSDYLRLNLHKLSLSVTVYGVDGDLGIFVHTQVQKQDEELRFLFEQPITALDFSKYSYTNNKKQSTIDSLFVIRNFPLEKNIRFVSRSEGDLQITSDPNTFTIYNFTNTKNGFYMRAGERLSRLTIREGPITTELVPGFLVVATEHPTTILIITWLGWVMSIFIPLYSKFKSKS